MKIAVLVGSLRKESFSLKVAKNLIKLAQEMTLTNSGENSKSNNEIVFELIDLNLPLYNQDYDDFNNVPETYINFRNKISSSDSFLFITPEYNRSMPAVLKNALDVASRPPGQNCWAKKPGAIISVTPGMLGAVGANLALRQSMIFLDVRLMNQPEMYIGNIGVILGENGELNPKSIDFFQKFINSFLQWTKNCQSVLPDEQLYTITITKNGVECDEPNFVFSYEFINGSNKLLGKYITKNVYYELNGKRKPCDNTRISGKTPMRLALDIFKDQLDELNDYELLKIKTDGYAFDSVCPQQIGLYRKNEEIHRKYSNRFNKGTGKFMIREYYIQKYAGYSYYGVASYDSLCGCLGLLQYFNDDGKFVIKYQRKTLD